MYIFTWRLSLHFWLSAYPPPSSLPCASVSKLRYLFRERVRETESWVQPKDPCHICSDRSRSSMVLHKAVQAAREGDVEALRALHASGCLSPTITDVQGASPVHHAARNGQLDCLEFLVHEGQFPCNTRSKNGATAAHDAAATGHIRELQWLLKQENCGIEVSSVIYWEKNYIWQLDWWHSWVQSAVSLSITQVIDDGWTL